METLNQTNQNSDFLSWAEKLRKKLTTFNGAIRGIGYCIYFLYYLGADESFRPTLGWVGLSLSVTLMIEMMVFIYGKLDKVKNKILRAVLGVVLGYFAAAFIFGLLMFLLLMLAFATGG